jgi:hypothetical protein
MAKITTQLFGQLAIVPQQAETPVRETLEFLTDVLESYNGSEQRLQLRTKARQTYAYTIPLQAWHTAAAFNTEYGAIRKRWAVPIWTEAQYVGNILSNAPAIVCDTTNYDLRDESLAMIYAGCDKWQVVEIASVEPGQINLLSNVNGFVGAWLIPVRIGFISNTIDKPTNGHNGKSTLTFEIEDTSEITSDAPSQYLGNDIYYEVGFLSGDSISRTIEKRLDKNDFSLGLVERRSPWENTRFATPYRKVLDSPSEVADFKKWLYRRAGKFRSFWLPTFEVNMRVVNTGVIASTLLISADSYIDYASVRTNIAIQANDGTWYNRTVSNPLQINSSTIQLTLSSALNLDASKVSRVSYLGLNRLDADRIELNWRGAGVVESEIRILELNP